MLDASSTHFLYLILDVFMTEHGIARASYRMGQYY